LYFHAKLSRSADWGELRGDRHRGAGGPVTPAIARRNCRTIANPFDNRGAVNYTRSCVKLWFLVPSRRVKCARHITHPWLEHRRLPIDVSRVEEMPGRELEHVVRSDALLFQEALGRLDVGVAAAKLVGSTKEFSFNTIDKETIVCGNRIQRPE